VRHCLSGGIAIREEPESTALETSFRPLFGESTSIDLISANSSLDSASLLASLVSGGRPSFSAPTSQCCREEDLQALVAYV
jgi:hypothetical protein